MGCGLGFRYEIVINIPRQSSTLGRSLRAVGYTPGRNEPKMDKDLYIEFLEKHYKQQKALATLTMEQLKKVDALREADEEEIRQLRRAAMKMSKK